MSKPKRAYRQTTALLIIFSAFTMLGAGAQPAVANGFTTTAPSGDALTASGDTQAKVDAYLAAHRGGVQINSREISYGADALIITVVPETTALLAAADCPSGWFCFYEGVSYTYPRGRLSSCGWQNLATWGWANRVESVHYMMSAGTVAFLNEAGATDSVLFTVSTSKRAIADVGSSRNRADYVSRTGC